MEIWQLSLLKAYFPQVRWTWAHGCQPIRGLRLLWWFTGKQSSWFGQFSVCFPDRFGTTEVSSDHPKFYFFYEIQREAFILGLPCWDCFMSFLSISQYTRARAIGLICPFHWSMIVLQRRPQPGSSRAKRKQQAFHQAVCAPLQVTAAGSRPCQPLSMLLRRMGV